MPANSHFAAVIVSALVLLSCAHAAPVCPAPCANGTRSVLQGTEDTTLTHEALYGADIAPPDVLNPPDDAYVTEGGVRTLLLESGTGTVYARRKDRVVISFVGWTRSKGERYDASSLRGGKDTVPVAALVPGLVEVVRMMVAGEKRRIWIPAQLAYGSSPAQGKPAGDLVVELKLHEVIQVQDPPPAPLDVAAPPADAHFTGSGLAYKILKKGTGKRRPNDTHVVKVHYTGWTADGQVFDSSIPRGEPTALSISGVIPGWQEALQLMVEGDKFRVWIPADLAYGEKPERPGAPAGPLCFDVELISIQ